jgi:hypothetical protein
MAVCRSCGRPLCADEISVNLKLVSRQAREYLCKSCLAAYFDCDEELIDQKIRQFKRNGCLLFSRGEAEAP